MAETVVFRNRHSWALNRTRWEKAQKTAFNELFSTYSAKRLTLH